MSLHGRGFFFFGVCVLEKSRFASSCASLPKCLDNNNSFGRKLVVRVNPQYMYIYMPPSAPHVRTHIFIRYDPSYSVQATKSAHVFLATREGYFQTG